MKNLMEQWSRDEVENVFCKDLFDALELLSRGSKGWKLKYAYNATYAILLNANTRYIEEKEGLTEEKCKEKEKKFITQLHKYNRVKDIAQEILGALAEKKEKTVKELSEEYDVEETKL